MTETVRHPSPAMLRRLSTLHELPADELAALSERLDLHEASRGSVLLDFGADDDTTLYLIEGSCRLTAADGGEKSICHTAASALAPLARLRPSQYRIVAETDVRYLRIENALVKEAEGRFEQASSLTLENYQVDEDDAGCIGAENRLTLRIYEDLNSGHLLLPSLPQVAVRIGEAVNEDNANARSVAALIETDSAIALKIVKAANSARYGGVTPVANVSDAVARLGMHNTRILVITFALRELFRTSSKTLQARMLELWEHSRRVAALASVLGDKVGGFNRHEALLAGLVHDIGVLAVIGYARDFPDVADDPRALESSARALRAQLGGMILSTWQLPAELTAVARESENWYRRHPGGADYADLVIAAHLHEGIGGDIDPAQVPALGLLGLSAEDVSRGLDILHEAHEEVAEAKRLLAG